MVFEFVLKLHQVKRADGIQHIIGDEDISNKTFQ